MIKFSLARGECLNLTLSLGVILCQKSVVPCDKFS